MWDFLTATNPWWDEEKVPAQMLGKTRTVYLDRMEKNLRSLNTLIITGPRRTGKTTLNRQYIQRLLDSGISPRSILYLQLDHPSMPKENAILEALKELRKEFALARREKIHLFLDEAQYARDWARQVKVLGENEKVEIVVSGSNASVLEPQAISFLVGRQTKLRVWPLSFKEYLEFRGEKILLSEQYLYSSKLKEYLRIGGFPKAVLEEDAQMRIQYLTDLMEDVVYKDIVLVHKVKDIKALRDLAFLLVSGIGSTASINKLSKLTKLSLETTREYLNHLQSCYIFHSIGFYSRSVNERTYNPKKYYLIDTGISSSLMGKETFGCAAENAAFEHLRRQDVEVYYWKERFELDFFVPKRKLALECKFTDSVEERDIKGLIAFLEKYRMKEGIVTTDSIENELNIKGKIIRMIPLWKFLLSY